MVSTLIKHSAAPLALSCLGHAPHSTIPVVHSHSTLTSTYICLYVLYIPIVYIYTCTCTDMLTVTWTFFVSVTQTAALWVALVGLRTRPPWEEKTAKNAPVQMHHTYSYETISAANCFACIYTCIYIYIYIYIHTQYTCIFTCCMQVHVYT